MAETSKMGSHWAWFCVLIAFLGLVGFCIAVVAMLPLAMATDPCHGDDSPFRVCHMSIRGENFLILVPWITLVGAMFSAVGAAALFARKKLSPLFGLLFWFLGAAAFGAIAYEAAFHI